MQGIPFTARDGSENSLGRGGYCPMKFYEREKVMEKISETLRGALRIKHEELALEFTKAFIVSGRSYSDSNTFVMQGIAAADEFMERLKITQV